MEHSLLDFSKKPITYIVGEVFEFLSAGSFSSHIINT